MINAAQKRVFSLSGADAVDKRSPLVAKVKEEVDKEYADGRTTVMGDMELEVIVRRCDKDRYEHLLFHKSK